MHSVRWRKVLRDLRRRIQDARVLHVEDEDRRQAKEAEKHPLDAGTGTAGGRERDRHASPLVRTATTLSFSGEVRQQSNQVDRPMTAPRRAPLVHTRIVYIVSTMRSRKN